jgi:UPF0716 family protein affecting phage T7 exclusion
MFFLLFIVWVFLEIFTLVQAASLLGGWITFGLLAFSFLAGVFVLRCSRFSLFGKSPPKATRLFFSSLAGVLLILPGFISDFLALLLLIPGVQDFIACRAGEYFMEKSGLNRILRFGVFFKDEAPPRSEEDSAEKYILRPEEGDTPEGEASGPAPSSSARRKNSKPPIIDVHPED